MRWFAVLVVALSMLFSLTNCGTAPHGFGELLWWDHATGAEFNGIETLGHERDLPPPP